MPQYHQKGGPTDRTFRGGNPPTGEKDEDITTLDAIPGIDVGASELPLHGDLGFPGSPNVSPDDPDKGPVDVAAEAEEQITRDSPR